MNILTCRYIHGFSNFPKTVRQHQFRFFNYFIFLKREIQEQFFMKSRQLLPTNSVTVKILTIMSTFKLFVILSIENKNIFLKVKEKEFSQIYDDCDIVKISLVVKSFEYNRKKYYLVELYQTVIFCKVYEKIITQCTFSIMGVPCEMF